MIWEGFGNENVLPSKLIGNPGGRGPKGVGKILLREVLGVVRKYRMVPFV
jgi:hypothetical protein